MRLEGMLVAVADNSDFVLCCTEVFCVEFPVLVKNLSVSDDEFITCIALEFKLHIACKVLTEVNNRVT